MKEASWYSRLPGSRVECFLCPHHCKIFPGHHGLCLTRENVNGTLIATNYCRPVSCAIDPIEKKPLYHFHPGTRLFSTGPAGCNFKCVFCQNHEISQHALDSKEISLEKLFNMVLDSGSIGIAYTYSEPTIWFETIMDLGIKVRSHGLKNVMVTNGYVEPGPLNDLLKIVDAMNIDIKSMSPSFYRELCKGSLPEVLRSCEAVKNAGCHLEITNLLIPGENDTPEETASLTDFIAGTLGKETPLHLSRYFPRYRMDHPATSPFLLERAWAIAREKLDYVYIGNLASGREHTRCPDCGEIVVSRHGYDILITPNLSGKPAASHTLPYCVKCNHPIAMVL